MQDSKTNNDINFLFQQARALFQQGNVEVAKNYATKLLKLAPGHAGGLQLLGGINTHMGNYQAAVDLFTAAIGANPEAPGNYNNLGYVLHLMGKLKSARKACLAAIRLKPDFAVAYNTLAVVLKDMKCWNESLDAIKKAIQLSPGFFEAYLTLTSILIETGKFKEAISACQCTLQLKPDFAQIYNLQAVALVKLGSYKEALTSCEEGIRFQPGLVDLYVTQGNILSEQGMMQAALAVFNKVIEMDDTQAMNYYNRANVYSNLGRFVDAENDYRSVLAIDAQHADAHSNLLFTQASAAQLSYPAMLEKQLQWDEVHGRFGRLEKFSIKHRTKIKNTTLRVGYISADFCMHPVGYFFLPLLSAHNKSRVETFCYANMAESQADSVTHNLCESADHWHFVLGKNDAELARLIHKDKIDILIDLSGHSRGNRLKVFTYRPAPIQAMYLGYCASSGLRDMDYWITDEVMHPFDTPELSSEEIIRLPRCSFVYQPPQEAEIPVSSGHNDGVVFASYSHFSKLLPDVIETWAEILLKVTGSKLFIIDKYMVENKSRDLLLKQFLLNGVDEDRLFFSGHLSYTDYYASYSNVDIVLDPFPRTGGTTTADSLWMGVPVITLAGSRYVERLSMCKLHAVGLDELVATNKEQYINIALRLAGNKKYLQELRKSLRGRMQNSQLSDGRGLALAMESAYEKMWGIWMNHAS